MQINQIFTRRIKSYLKKDSLSASFIFCIKLLNASFSSRLRNNSPTQFFFFFSSSSFSFQIKPLVAKIKCLSLQAQTWCQKNFKIQILYMWTKWQIFWKLSSNIVGKFSPNIAIYRLVLLGTEFNRNASCLRQLKLSCLH